MIKDIFEAIKTAGRKIFTNWGASLISFLIYGALLGVIYLFFTTREATAIQVLLSIMILPLVAIFLFFLMQAMGLSYVQIGVGVGYLLKRALSDSWKLLLVTIPLILIASLILLLGGRINSRVVTYLHYLLLYLVFPLIAIHLWLSTVRDGIGVAFRGIWKSIKDALGPRSLLIYALLVMIFGVFAYFLFFTKTPLSDEWAELWLFGARFAAALLSIFTGWLLTLGSLAELSAKHSLKEKE
jgi:hypothetical protein